MAQQNETSSEPLTATLRLPSFPLRLALARTRGYLAVRRRTCEDIPARLGAAQRRAGNHFGRRWGPWNRRWSNGQQRLKMPGAAALIILDEAKAQGDR